MHFDDGSSIILVNTRCPEEATPEGLGPFFRYVNLAAEDVRQLGAHYKSGDVFVDEINRRVYELNEQEEIKIMESFEDRLARENSYHRRIGREEGEKIGREATQLSTLDKMLALGYPHTAIMEILSLPEEVILRREKEIAAN